MDKIFDGKKTAKLGTAKNPAKVSVKTKKKQKELAAQFEAHGWHYQIDVVADKSEDLTDLDILMNPVKTVLAEQKTGRNDPCPCGSGKKYKKCCGP
jgi:SWIM/SEC-C metal-binding protein